MKHERLEQTRRVSLVGLNGEGNEHGRDPTITDGLTQHKLQASSLSIYAFSKTCVLLYILTGTRISIRTQYNGQRAYPKQPEATQPLH
jgi:hypothetical protein